MKLSVGFHFRCAELSHHQPQRVPFRSIDRCIFHWLCCWGRCWMYDPGDILSQSSADLLSNKQFLFYASQTFDFGGSSELFICITKLTTSDQLPANCSMVGNPCNLQVYAVRFILSRMCMLSVIHWILTWSWLYIPYNFPLLFIIILLSMSTPTNYHCIKTTGRRV